MPCGNIPAYFVDGSAFTAGDSVGAKGRSRPEHYEAEFGVGAQTPGNFFRKVFRINHKEDIQAVEYKLALEGKVGLAGVDGMQLGQRHSVADRRGHTAEVDVGMPQQQAQQLFAFGTVDGGRTVDSNFNHDTERR